MEFAAGTYARIATYSTFDYMAVFSQRFHPKTAVFEGIRLKRAPFDVKLVGGHCARCET